MHIPPANPAFLHAPPLDLRRGKPYNLRWEKQQMTYATLARELAAHIRGAVRPLIGTTASRDITGTASSGDATFSIDNVAEEAVVRFITDRGLNLAVYTED